MPVPLPTPSSPCLWCGGRTGHSAACLGAGAERESETSVAAALSIASAAASLRERVLGAIRDRGPAGLTDDEGEVLLAMRHQTYSARRRELFLDGKIVKSGARRWTRSKRYADVYVVKVSP